jgi:uncharacterized protein
VGPSALAQASPSTSIFSSVKSSSWRFVLLSIFVVFGLVTEINHTFHDEGEFFTGVLNATGQLVTPTLLGAGLLAIVIVGGLIVLGHLSFRDLGWKRENFVPGIAAAAVLWIVMQLVEVIADFAINGQFRLSPAWSGMGAGAMIGVLVGQSLGTAPAEETFFRGFLLPQLRVKFNRMKTGVAIGLAIVVSQLVFSLYHVPNLLLGNSGRVGTGSGDIATQLVLDLFIGVVFAALYIRTGNLFLVMGIHALQNAGTSLVATPIDPALVMFALAISVVLGTFAPAVARRLPGSGPRPHLPNPMPS